MVGRVSRRTVLTATAATGVVAAGAGAWTLWGGRGEPADPTPPATPPAGGTPVVAAAPAATPMAVVAGTPDGFLAVAPRVLRAGQAEAVSVALFRGDRPARDTVSVALLKDGRPVADASARSSAGAAWRCACRRWPRATIS